MRVTPQQFAYTVTDVADLLESWGWLTQEWGQETIKPEIRRILLHTENGLRHIGDLLAARPAVARCDHCSQPHGDLVCHIDVKSTTRSFERRTGKLSLEVRSWQALRDESRATIPALFTFEPWSPCAVTDLLWIPAFRLDPQDMIVGPQTGNGSGDPYWLVPAGMARRIISLRCWDGWS